MSGRLKGILALVGSAFGFATMAMCVRLCDDCGGAVSSIQKSFFRNLVALAVAAFVFVRCGFRLSSAPMKASTWGVLLLRALFGTAGIFANFYALGHIPIADGQALNKTAPFFTVLFAWIFMGERMSLRQVGALVLGFLGALLVVKPGGASCGAAAVGLFSGFCAGTAYACLRKLALAGVRGPFIVLFFSVFSCLASVPFMCHRLDPMSARQVLVLLGAGVGAAVGQFGITAAYRFAPPKSIAVYDYTSILFAAAYGFVLFGQVPDLLSVLGFAVILFAAVRNR